MRFTHLEVNNRFLIRKFKIRLQIVSLHHSCWEAFFSLENLRSGGKLWVACLLKLTWSALDPGFASTSNNLS